MHRFIAAAISVALLVSMAVAQNISGTIQGTVKDSSGGVVSAATITVTNEDTNIQYKAATGATGEYQALNLPPGTYTVTVASSGFKTNTNKGVRLLARGTSRVDVMIQPGAVSETVEVRATVAAVNSENATVGTTMEAATITALPLNGRTVDRLILLAPGVTSSSVSNPRVAGSAYWGGIQFNVDGQNLNDSGNGGAIYSAGGRTGLSNLPTIDSISELRVDSNNQKAEFEAAATVMLVSKSGSNQFHGSLYEFNRNKVFAAKDALLSASSTKAPFNRNEFGGTFGGPIRKDKTFFFVDAESLRQRIYQTNKLSVATSAMRNGDFSGLPTIVDPLSGLPFANNQVPTNRIDSRSRTLIGYVPQSNLAGSGPAGTLNNWLGQTGQPMNVNRYGVRVDHRFSDKDSIWTKFNYSGGFPYFLAQGTPPNYGNKTASRDVWNATFTHIHTLTPSTINEFRFGYLQTGYTANGQNDTFDPQSLFPDLYAPAQPGLGGLPNVAIANHIMIGDTGGYLRSPQGTTQFIDNFTHVRGRHTLKTGIDIDRFTIATNPSATLGNFNFTGRFTNNVPTSGAQPAHAFADFLLGYPNSTVRSTATGYYVIKTTRYSAYVQDDWQVSSRLTLNFGVRYSVQPAWQEINGNQSNFDFSSGKLVLAGSEIPTLALRRLLDALPIQTSTQAGRPNQVAETDANNFAPRFGFAFRPTKGNKTVIRGGVGMFYNFIPAFIGFRQLSGANPPFILAETFESSAGSVPSLTLAKPFPGSGAINGNPSITAVDRNIQNSLSQQWNFTLERELRPSLGFRTSYVGNKTTHLPFYNYARNLSRQQISGALQPNRPYQPWSDISVLESSGDSTIHQLQIEAIQRYSHGISMQLEYSFNRSLDNVPIVGGPQNPYNAAIERGNSDNISRHILTVAGNYELPFGPGKQFANSSSWSKVVGGWQLGGIAFLRTGAPFSTSFSPTMPGWRAGRPDVLVDPKLSSSERSRDRWFNTAAFAVPTPFVFGNSARNALFGPGLIDVDISVLKDTSITERFKVQFRAESFNFANHANLGTPATNMSVPATFGKITTASGSRVLQFGIKLLF